jgi:mRNA interferase RelE/StbE
VARRFAVEIAPAGYQSLKALRDRKTRSQIAKTIDSLARSPESQGKALAGPLEGLRSARAARDRHRILYRVDTENQLVSVLLVARRKAGAEDDVYAVARKLLRALMR